MNRGKISPKFPPEDIQSFIDGQMEPGRKGKTARNITKILNVPFALAQRQGLILTNPVAASDIPDDAGESKSPFTQEQVQKILKAATGDWKRVIMLGIYTGARLRDCANMTWANVDLPGKLLRYHPRKTKRYAKDVVCPIHPSLEAFLLTLPSADKPDAPISPSLIKHYTGGRK
jgi:integrase